MSSYYIKNGRSYTKTCGVGINDADYVVMYREYDTNGKVKHKCCPLYSCWQDMLRRCYSEKFKSKNPTYKDVTCCKEWLTFSNFKSWMEQQDWEGKQLDKDLLVYKNKIYSPETCVFVSREVNCFMSKRDSCRGLYPLGVSRTGGWESFKAACNDPSTNIKKYLGSRSTPHAAHKLWQQQKILGAVILKDKQTDPTIIKGLQRVIDKIQHDLDNNLITEDF